MKIAAMWIVLFKACACSAMFPLSKRRLIEASVALLGGLLLASSFARAVTLHEDDIVGLGLSSNKLLRIDGRTGVRSVISDFSNPAEGPVGGGSGVAISRGQIFVTGENGRIFLVDHRTGRRSVVGDLNQGAIQGSVYPGMAVDPFGRIIGSLQTQPGARTGGTKLRWRRRRRAELWAGNRGSQRKSLSCEFSDR
jgi:hypothetical protein